MTIWKEIKNFETYSISICGKVKSKNFQGKESLLSITDNGNGYQRVYLYKNGKRTKFFIHRLVADSFISNTNSSKIQVHHIDHVRDNNHVDNLMWCTAKENIAFKLIFNQGIYGNKS